MHLQQAQVKQPISAAKQTGKLKKHKVQGREGAETSKAHGNQPPLTLLFKHI